MGPRALVLALLPTAVAANRGYGMREGVCGIAEFLCCCIAVQVQEALHDRHSAGR
jgi:hypothetical protein